MMAVTQVAMTKSRMTCLLCKAIADFLRCR
jgi:hypothetical protein